MSSFGKVKAKKKEQIIQFQKRNFILNQELEEKKKFNLVVISPLFFSFFETNYFFCVIHDRIFFR